MNAVPSQPNPIEAALRAAVVLQAQALNRNGLSAGTSGNVSARFGDGLLMTPSGRAYESLRPEDIVPVSLKGRWQHPLPPSSEWRLHRDIYAARPEVGAVVHAHPPHCTALAIHGRGIPAVHYMVALAGGPDVRCAAYATYGTQALSDAVAVALQGRQACLMAHHGMLAVGDNLERAMWRAVELEALARQYLLALQLGPPPLLPDDEIERVVAKFRRYGAAAEPEADADSAPTDRNRA